MKLLILVAGKGERLYPLTKNTPKSLLEIGGGVTLLETQLEAAKTCGVEEVVLVIGYKGEQVEAKIRDLPIQVTALYNPFYHVSNNLISAWMARDHLEGEFVLVNGDVVFRPEVLQGLLDHGKGDICMVIDRKDDYDDDDMKVTTKDDRVWQVSKKLPLAEVNGESIGMMRFSTRGSQIFRKTLDTMVRDPDNLNVFYLAALQRIMEGGVPVNFYECGVTDWAEMDFHPDLKLIRDNIKRFDDRIASWSLPSVQGASDNKK